MNQALLEKLWVESDGRITAELTEPLKSIMQPIQDELVQYNTEKGEGRADLPDFLRKMQNHVQDFFGHGLSKDTMVGLQGLEPRTYRL